MVHASSPVWCCLLLLCKLTAWCSGACARNLLVLHRMPTALCCLLPAGKQEPGSNGDIKSFAQKQGARFPLMAKTDVNGPTGVLACCIALQLQRKGCRLGGLLAHGFLSSIQRVHWVG